MSDTKILIVEDEVLIAEDLRLVLKRMGHQVIGMASSGTEAIRKADELHPNLVLMDVRLQGVMDGVEAARRIKSKADIAVVYVTAHASILASLEIRHRCTLLAKPFSPLQLQAAIVAVTSETQRQAQ